MKNNINLINLCIIIIILLSGQASTRDAFISSKEINALEKSGHLIPAGDYSWKTRDGLMIRGRDTKGLSRLEHIMRHASDLPRRNKHGVFSISKEKIIELMDETWNKIRSKQLHGLERGGRIAYTYNTKKTIGYLGGKKGKERGHPEISSVRMVLKKGTSEVITFFQY
jgi:hypothetical protein